VDQIQREKRWVNNGGRVGIRERYKKMDECLQCLKRVGWVDEGGTAVQMMSRDFAKDI
jgi:hypothetical protein